MSRIPASHIALKRAYDPPAESDGERILVDRLWPRGVRKEAAAVDHWAKDVAPTPALRTWFGHDPARWDEFRRRYAAELDRNRDEVQALRALARKGPITLVYAAHDTAHNHAIVLRQVLLGGTAAAKPRRA